MGISILIALLFWWAIWLIFMNHVAKTTIPPRHVGYDGEKLYEPGHYKTIYQVQIVDLSPRLTTVKSGNRTLILTWVPDRQNLPAFFRNLNLTAAIVQLYASLPNPDLPHYEALWGFKVTKIDGDAPKEKGPESIELGEGIELQY
jgi:hypothetical protein